MTTTKSPLPNLSELGANGNYFEFILQDEENRTDIPDRLFGKLLQQARSNHTSCFQKHFKEYAYRNMFLENNDTNQIKLYKKTLTHASTLENGMKLLVFGKEKLPYQVFPSQMSLHSVSWVSRAVVKINNRVFLNFEKRTYEPSGPSPSDREASIGAEAEKEKEEDSPTPKPPSYNKIYINYNHDHNVDIEASARALRACMDLVS